MAANHQQRVRARRCAVQALYQWLITEQDPVDILTEFLSERELTKVDTAYFELLAREVPAHRDALVALLQPALDRDWSAVNPVERAVLLIGAYELANCEQVPRRVVINESVELVKMFGAAEGYRYINAVLDKLSKTVRQVEAAQD